MAAFEGNDARSEARGEGEERLSAGRRFFEDPILNSPYEEPRRHWEIDAESNQPTGKIVEARRPSSNQTPIAASCGNGSGIQGHFDERIIDSVAYRPNELINEIRQAVKAWRESPESAWGVTAETARLLKHWRHHEFPTYRPFYCQIEAVETLIWLTEVAPATANGKEYLRRIAEANAESDPALYRIALKLATGAGKTTVMAMIIAWQTVNAHRHGVSDKFTNGFLITTPGITIRDRLRVLIPNDPNAYYGERNLVPQDLLPVMGTARVVITNYHAYELKTVMELSAGTRLMLNGAGGAGPQEKETPGQMMQRVMKELIGLKNILMINDEAHHCYRHRPVESIAVDVERPADDDDNRDEIKKNDTMARVWISGLEGIRERIGSERCRPKVIDLSATPFFLRGSGYEEGTQFPWTASDFSLLDALECGIVKLPRIPVDDNMAQGDVPKYRELWKSLREDPASRSFCRLGRAQRTPPDPQNLPNLLQTAIGVLYKGYERTFELWKAAGIKIPPCMIFVCQNTTISKMVYDFISGHKRTDRQGNEHFEKAKCELFSNYDNQGNALARPNTLLIDSEEVENGELSPEFKAAASKEIEIFKRELIARTGDRKRAEILDDSELLREVMNTVGKEGRLGESVRCVVSVSMLTEGWDANNVTHILGVRAFGTQLLCEQVVGRALRRLSYEADAKTGLYRAEYSDIFGIPFDFASGVVNPPPITPPDLVHVHAIRPKRDALEIRFPRVTGYYIDHRDAWKLDAQFTEESALSVTPADIGPTQVLLSGFVGEREKLELGDSGLRRADVEYHLARHFIRLYYNTDQFTNADRTQLFAPIRHLFGRWMREGHLRVDPSVGIGCVALYKNLADLACQRVKMAIVRAERQKGDAKIRALIDPYLPTGTTSRVNFRISSSSAKGGCHETAEDKCHVNYAVCDSSWETALCRVLEEHPQTLAYVKNFNLGFEVPYVMGSERRNYLPDFIVLADDGHGREDPLHLVVEVKGYRYQDADVKKATMQELWIPGVNAEGAYGRWRFLELNANDFLCGGLTAPGDLTDNCRHAYAEKLKTTIAGGNKHA